VLLIDADCESTWPQALLQGLDAGRQALVDFQIERARIDRAAQLDDMLRTSNPHRGAWDAALALAEHSIASGYLLGFHATRLMDHEVREIKTSGLEPLSVELLRRRLVAAQGMGALTAKQTARLLACHQAAEDNRSGRTAFFFTRAQLKDAGLDRLCRYWGGEALYNWHKDDRETGPLLRNLGMPCIVVAAVRATDIERRFDIGYHLVNVWCARRNIATDFPPEFGGVVRTHTPAENIIRIIRISDPEFVVLTQHDKWRAPLT
jgi:hypothetical protein